MHEERNLREEEKPDRVCWVAVLNKVHCPVCGVPYEMRVLMERSHAAAMDDRSNVVWSLFNQWYDIINDTYGLPVGNKLSFCGLAIYSDVNRLVKLPSGTTYQQMTWIMDGSWTIKLGKGIQKGERNDELVNDILELSHPLTLVLLTENDGRVDSCFETVLAQFTKTRDTYHFEDGVPFEKRRPLALKKKKKRSTKRRRC